MMAEPKHVASDGTDLSDEWVMHGSRMSNEGDATEIDALLSTELVEVAAADGG
jgi:hypothetical protein